MEYKDTLKYMYEKLPEFQRIGAAAYKADLINTLALDEYFGHPHRNFKTIHVAGTNGKGSVSHMLASVLQSAGYRVGLYTSPHLTDFRERIKVDGQMIPETDVVNFVEKHREAIERIRPSFFELTVLMAFDYFSKSGVDVAVIEVGMGGRLDSTNIINPIVSVITNISLDHTQFLGDTIGKIAAEKAGIIKPKIPVIVGESNPESAVVFIDKAKGEGSRLLFADKSYACLRSDIIESGQRFTLKRLYDDYEFDLTVDLLGEYQRKNILTVMTALDVISETINISSSDVEKGLSVAAKSTGLCGRWQIISEKPLVVCDTGHNKAGLQDVLSQISTCSYDRLYMIVGFVSDKDVRGVMGMFPKDAYYIFTQASIERAMDAEKVAEIAAEYDLEGCTIKNVSEAFDKAKTLAKNNDMIFVGGSTFVVADFLEKYKE